MLVTNHCNDKEGKTYIAKSEWESKTAGAGL